MSRPITRPCSLLILKYSSFDPPVFLSVSVASLIASLVRSALISAVDALSTFLMMRSSRSVALPEAPPPPIDDLPCMPHDQLKTSISFLCLSSFDSPLIRPCLAPLTLKNMSPTPVNDLPSAPGATSTVLKRLRFLLRLDVVLEVDARLERTVRLLRLVLEIHLREREADLLGGAAAVAVRARRHARDDDVGHLDHEELLLAFSRLAVGDRRVLEVMTRGARLKQHGRRFVDLVRERQIVEV